MRKLLGFVELCRAFGLEVSPAETVALVSDFGGLDMGDRALMEEAAVAALARDTEAEEVVRRLFRLYFGGERPERAQPVPTTQPEAPAPPRHATARAPRAALTAEQLEVLLAALEALAEAGGAEVPELGWGDGGFTPPGQGLPDQLFAEAANAVSALLAEDGGRGRDRQGERNGRGVQELERTLREMARRGKRASLRAEVPERAANRGHQSEDGDGAGAGAGEQGGGSQGQDGRGERGREGEGDGSSMRGTGRGGGLGVPAAGIPGTGRGEGGHGASVAAERAAQRLGDACAALVAAGAVSPEVAGRLAAALQPSLAKAFAARFSAALGDAPPPLRRQRLEEAAQSIAGRLLADGALPANDAVRLLRASDERLRLQTVISGAGLRSLMHDAEALTGLLERYRRNRELLPVLVAKLSAALKRMVTRPSPVLERADSGRLDFRATLRDSAAYGGVPIEFRYKRKRREHEIVLLLDTSGSQRAWAASAVLAAHALCRLLPKLRAYTFTSSIVEVTEYLARPERFIQRLSDFGGASDYLASLEELEREARLGRRTTLLIIGDCRDAQGSWRKESEGRYSRYIEPASAKAMGRLVTRCRRVVVLNPEEESRWCSGDSAAEHYQAAGAEVVHVRSPLHLAEQLARLSMVG